MYNIYKICQFWKLLISSKWIWWNRRVFTVISSFYHLRFIWSNIKFDNLHILINIYVRFVKYFVALCCFASNCQIIWQIFVKFHWFFNPGITKYEILNYKWRSHGADFMIHFFSSISIKFTVAFLLHVKIKKIFMPEM